MRFQTSLPLRVPVPDCQSQSHRLRVLASIHQTKSLQRLVRQQEFQILVPPVALPPEFQSLVRRVEPLPVLQTLALRVELLLGLRMPEPLEPRERRLQRDATSLLSHLDQRTQAGLKQA